MSYKRKTKDVFEVQGYYSGAWESVTSEETRKEALARLKEYQENEPGAFKIVKKREKKHV